MEVELARRGDDLPGQGLEAFGIEAGPALRALIAQTDAWEMVTFEDEAESPISYALNAVPTA